MHVSFHLFYACAPLATALGLRAYRSTDAATWTVQPKLLLSGKGGRADDGNAGSHCDVVVRVIERVVVHCVGVTATSWCVREGVERDARERVRKSVKECEQRKTKSKDGIWPITGLPLRNVITPASHAP